MDEASSLVLFLAVLPKLHIVIKALVGHILRVTENSSKWDLQTEIAVKVIRAYVDSSGKPRTMSESQAASIKDPGVRGHKWISRYTIPKPKEDDIRQHMFKALDDLRQGGEVFHKPELLPVEVEWTGYRRNAKPKDHEPNISEAEKNQ